MNLRLVPEIPCRQASHELATSLLGSAGWAKLPADAARLHALAEILQQPAA